MQPFRIQQLALVLSMIFSPSLRAAPADPLCLAQKCGGNLLACGFDSECRQWLSCVIGCGEDKIGCPSFCGFYFQSAQINKTNQCIFTSQCVDLGFGEFPAYLPGEAAGAELSAISGDYWFAASFGGDHIFAYDCQHFSFSPSQNESKLQVNFTVPLQYKKKERLTGASGAFRTLESGAIEVVYENFAGYHEKWDLIDVSPETILAHVCIGDDSLCYDYGTILLSRHDPKQWDSSLRTRLEAKVTEHLGVNLASFKLSRVSECVAPAKTK